MASTTASNSLQELLPQIVAEAMFVASERSIMRGLVKNYALGSGQGKTVTVPIYPLQTAATLAEGSEITDSTVNTSSAVLTVTTAAIRTLVTDLAVASASSNVVADIGRLFGEAIARKIDTDLTAQFANLSGANNYDRAITAADIFEAVARLKAAAVPTEGMVCVLHPAIAYDLKAALTTGGNTPFTVGGGASEVANEAMRSGYVGQLAGIPVFETSNIAAVAPGTAAAGEFNGAVFHRDALGLAMIGDITIETERRASFLGTDIVGACHYGAGLIQSGYGRVLAFDLSIINA
jgi:N4-gp56 family major capsid protein